MVPISLIPGHDSKNIPKEFSTSGKVGFFIFFTSVILLIVFNIFILIRSFQLKTDTVYTCGNRDIVLNGLQNSEPNCYTDENGNKYKIEKFEYVQNRDEPYHVEIVRRDTLFFGNEYVLTLYRITC